MPADETEALAIEGRLLGELIDEAHSTPAAELPRLIATKAEQAGLADLSLYLQDYDQVALLPLSDAGAEPLPIDGSAAGRAFATDTPVEEPAADGVRMWVPIVDGTDRVGVLGLTVPQVDDRVRRLVGRLAGLSADLLVTKGQYTDAFFQVRRSRPTELSAEMQWHLLPPLTLVTPSASVAGVVEPAYEVGGDAFDYALNDDTLHLGIVDAMGHGLRAAVMCSVAIGAYRHARRNEAGLRTTYAQIDAALADQFDDDHFATAQFARLDVRSGRLRWVNAGHPRPLLVRGGKVVDSLRAEAALPVGFGGASPMVAVERLEPGDRVLFFTDGVVEQELGDGDQLGFSRFARHVEQSSGPGRGVAETARLLSCALQTARPGELRDDATLLLVEWTGPGS